MRLARTALHLLLAGVVLFSCHLWRVTSAAGAPLCAATAAARTVQHRTAATTPLPWQCWIATEQLFDAAVDTRALWSAGATLRSYRQISPTVPTTPQRRQDTQEAQPSCAGWRRSICLHSHHEAGFILQVWCGQGSSVVGVHARVWYNRISEWTSYSAAVHNRGGWVATRAM